ncbi:helix-turn-helix transcriptional regulator [Pseudactinotalea sp. HY158]|uniref:helix-turn-helix domain-containing protein n=1 Tax=Pseudactinotalea sp. HY158 TaxID=2654547 RepID=UPI001E3C23A1|nr:helix-turn-helix transcriptional regulator [Pseudactinotalea sp. HY158]
MAVWLHTPIAERTAQIVSQAMVNAGISRQQLAEITPVPYSTLVRRLRGEQPFDLDEIFYIARALGVRPSSLLADELTDAKIPAA